MPLTDSQYTALWVDVSVTHAAEFADAMAATDDQAIADAYNLLASPNFWVYRTLITKEELVGQTSQDGTVFTWAGNGFITRSVQELMCFDALFDNAAHAVNPNLPQIRAALQDIFSGAGNAASNRAHCAAVARRTATRTEQLFATGTGSTGSPGTMTCEGPVNYMDVYYARTGVRP